MNTENEKVRPPTPQHGREKRRSSQASPASAKRPASPPLCSGFKPSTRQGISSLKRPSRAPNPLHRTEWKQVPATKTTTISPLGRPTGSPLNQSGPCPKPDIAPGKVRTRWVPWWGEWMPQGRPVCPMEPCTHRIEASVLGRTSSQSKAPGAPGGSVS